MTILKAENLKKYYPLGNTVVKALDGVNLSVEKGEFLSIVGKSGSGKSTLLHMLGGLDNPTSGRVLADGQDISLMDRDSLTIFRRRKIGFVFQNYNLLPLLNVYENVVLPIQLDGIRPDKDYVNHILDMLGLSEKRYAMPGQLPAANNREPLWPELWRPNLPLYWPTNPPVSGYRTGQDVLGLLKISQEQLNQTVVMITHDEEIAQMSQRIIRLEDGRICGGGIYD